MSTAVPGYLRPVPLPSAGALRRDPAAQAFQLMRIAFTVAPILLRSRQVRRVLTDDWTKYLATEFDDILPGSAQDAMYLVAWSRSSRGVIVLAAPRFGGLLVAGWLGRHHRQPAARRRLRRHRPARLRPAARRARRCRASRARTSAHAGRRRHSP